MTPCEGNQAELSALFEIKTFLKFFHRQVP